MLANDPLSAGLFLGAALTVVFYVRYRSRNSVPLPPGPKGRFILGEALEVRDASVIWLKFAEYADQHGPLVNVRVLNQNMFLLSDPHIAHELFEKRATNYSDRTVTPMIELAGWDKDVVFLSYSHKFKHFRTMLQRALNSRAALDYILLQQYEVQRFMRRLVETPGEFMEHVHLMAASIAIRVTYGYKADSIQDPFVQQAEESMTTLADLMSPGKWAVDLFPLLRHIPTWFPFFGFHQHAQYIRRLKHTAETKPFEYVLKQIADGAAEESFASKLLRTPEYGALNEEVKEDVKNLAAGLYGAASDTISAGVKTFFLAMTLYPDVQTKAQAEIDAYIQGQQRMILPTDRPSLPYTSALVREILRWHPISNLVAHQTGRVDDRNILLEGKTYRIPAQSVIIGNVWKMMHDPLVYPEPGCFNPERYLVDNPPPGPENYAFGFGRRICPGLHVAQHSIWIAISNILANFRISKARDINGAEIIPEEQYTTGVASHPLPFECVVSPKDDSARWIKELSE